MHKASISFLVALTATITFSIQGNTADQAAKVSLAKVPEVHQIRISEDGVVITMPNGEVPNTLTEEKLISNPILRSKVAEALAKKTLIRVTVMRSPAPYSNAGEETNLALQGGISSEREVFLNDVFNEIIAGVLSEQSGKNIDADDPANNYLVDRERMSFVSIGYRSTEARQPAILITWVPNDPVFTPEAKFEKLNDKVDQLAQKIEGMQPASPAPSGDDTPKENKVFVEAVLGIIPDRDDQFENAGRLMIGGRVRIDGKNAIVGFQVAQSEDRRGRVQMEYDRMDLEVFLGESRKVFSYFAGLVLSHESFSSEERWSTVKETHKYKKVRTHEERRDISSLTGSLALMCQASVNVLGLEVRPYLRLPVLGAQFDQQKDEVRETVSKIWHYCPDNNSYEESEAHGHDSQSGIKLFPMKHLSIGISIPIQIL